MMCCFFAVTMITFHCLTDEYSSKHGKDEGLQERNQYFDEINENGKRDRDHGRSDSKALS